jgi:hypothetical protein
MGNGVGQFWTSGEQRWYEYGASAGRERFGCGYDHSVGLIYKKHQGPQDMSRQDNRKGFLVLVLWTSAMIVWSLVTVFLSLRSHEPKINAIARYFGSLEDARLLISHGRTSIARIRVDAAVSRAQREGVLPLDTSGYPSEGEFLLWDLLRDGPDRDRFEKYDAYLRHAYSQFHGGSTTTTVPAE